MPRYPSPSLVWVADSRLLTPKRPRSAWKEVPLLREPLVVPDKILDLLLGGARQVECTPVKVPSDMRNGDIVRVETKSKKWFSHEEANFWICAQVRYRKAGPRRPEKVVLSSLALFPVSKLKDERISV